MSRLDKQSIENLKNAEEVTISEFVHRGVSYYNVACQRGQCRVYLHSADEVMVYPSVEKAKAAIKRHITDKCRVLTLEGVLK